MGTIVRTSSQRPALPSAWWLRLGLTRLRPSCTRRRRCRAHDCVRSEAALRDGELEDVRARAAYRRTSRFPRFRSTFQFTHRLFDCHREVRAKDADANVKQKARDTVRSTLGPSSSRRRRWLVVIGLAVLLLLGTGFAYLRVKLEGPDLGDKVASLLNKRMRGRIEIESIEWPTSALKTVVTGGWVPVTVRGVKVWDDCALSAGIGAADPDELRLGDPNEDCTPDDRPD